MVMIPQIGNEVIRKLSSRIKLSKITKNRGPSKFLRRRRRFRIIIIIKVKCVFEGSNNIREVTSEFVKLVVVLLEECGRVFGRRKFGSVVGSHKDLLLFIGGGGGSGGGGAA